MEGAVTQAIPDARSNGACVTLRNSQRLIPKQPPNWPFVATAQKEAHELHRVVRPEATFNTLKPFFRRIGITRIAEITHLDRLGIPVYSAFVPRSLDSISVYHGKGFRPIDAKTGAAMEATERYVASRERLPDEVASYRELSAKAPTVDPRRINHPLHQNYTDEASIAWLNGVDLLSGDRVFVPYSIACHCGLGYRWQASHAVTTSNGLASGNTIEEAACHALAEVIERDAHSMLEIFDLHLQALANRKSVQHEAWLKRLRQAWRTLFPVMDPDSFSGGAAVLINSFRRAGMEPELVYAGSECGAATVLCFLHEHGSATSSRLEYGAGADPNIAVAAIRAMTEVAQGRAACMEAVREDLTGILRTTVHPGSARSRETAVPSNFTRKMPAPMVSAASIPSDVTSDIVEDIRIMLVGLRQAGIERCVMIDLSVPEIPVSVVRIVAPGLESWVVDRKTIGPRAKARWREFASRVQ
jgi:ribosomal protein S12 methylthiotransferase accessory factor